MKVLKACVLAAFLAAPGSVAVSATERCPYLDYSEFLDEETITVLCWEWARSRPGTGTSSGDGKTWYGQDRDCAGSYSCQGVDV